MHDGSDFRHQSRQTRRDDGKQVTSLDRIGEHFTMRGLDGGNRGVPLGFRAPAETPTRAVAN